MSSKVSYAFLGDENSSSKNASAFPLGAVNGGDATVPLSIDAPPPVSVGHNVTTGSITIVAATGGSSPYTYSAAISYDSTGSYTAYISSVTSSTVSLAGLSNGQTLAVLITVTDNNGDTASVTAYVQVAASAGGTMTAGTFPASQTLANTETTASVTFNAVGGTFVAPVSYVATIVNGPGSVSNTGTSVSLSDLVSGTATLVRLRATDSTPVTPLTADAYALVVIEPPVTNPLAWVPVRDFDLTDAANALASIASGSQSVPLYDEVTGHTATCTMIVGMNSGSLTNAPSSIGTDGWKIAHANTATSTNTKQPIKIPLPSPIGNDDDFRVTIWAKTNLPVSGNSCYWQVCYDKGGATPNEDDNDCWGGNRLLKNGANSALYLKYQAGGSPAIISNSSTPPCPLTWLDGSTEVKMEMYLPRYTNRARMKLTGGSATIAADLGADGKTASANALRGGWVAGDSNVWIVHCATNGAANGLGAQYSTITRILIERRTLP